MALEWVVPEELEPMSFRPLFFCLALAAVTVSPMAVGAARAEQDSLKTPIEAEAPTRPRLAIGLAGPSNFMALLKTGLEGTRRFDVLNKPSVAATLRNQGIVLDGKLSVEKCRRAQKVADTDLVLDGKIESAGGNLRVTCRLYDFRTGEITRDLSLFGAGGDTQGLANTMAAFVRSSVPIRCAIRDMNDDQVVLDLGAMDGVVANTTYKVLRYPRNLKPREIGVVRVTKVDPFVAAGEVESSAQGVTLEPGDVLIEQTSSFMLTQ
jgi:hypothetical protein